MKNYRTLRFRLKDRHATVLCAMAGQVNFVWNYCNDLSHRSITERLKWLRFDELEKYTKGFTKCDGIVLHSSTVQAVCSEYATRRDQFRKNKLRWRVSNPKAANRSLGWIPFKKGAVKYLNGQIHLKKHKFSFWDSYGLSKYELCAGSFSEDARGRWYFNVQVLIEIPLSPGTQLIGIDLGLKTAAVCSNGSQLESRWYRQHEEKLAKSQRKNKKGRTQAIHAKIANKRKDSIHKFGTALVEEAGAIVVGNVQSKALVKTKMAKSVLDAGWGMLKRTLEYKCTGAGVLFEVVNESYTTQTCSTCGIIPASSPKGRSGLKVRRWTCCNCGAVHDRDINAAMNIAKRGHALLGL